MSDLKDFKNKNTEFTGTTGIDLPEGTTAQRVNQQGTIRYNTETQLAEYYATNWKSIDSPPTISGISLHLLIQMVQLYLILRLQVITFKQAQP